MTIQVDREAILCIDPEEVLQYWLWRCLVVYRAGYRCERCQEKHPPNKKKLVAHHINHKGDDNRLANGECLCQTCHLRHHQTGRTHTAATKRKMSESARRWRAERRAQRVA